MNNQIKNSKVTILDVAKHANVSISVVSNVLNHPNKVAEATIQRVKQSMEALGWYPNIRRRGPKNIERIGIRTGNLALLFLPTRPSQVAMNGPTNTELIYSLIHEANSLGFTLSVIDADPYYIFDVERLQRFYDGVLIFGISDDPDVINCLAQIAESVPTVWINRATTASEKIKCDYVYYDNNQVGPLAAEYFHRRNHTNVAVFSVSTLHDEYVTRINTFIAKARELGMTPRAFAPDTKAELAKKYTYSDICHALAKEYLKQTSATALFFCSDDCMLATSYELRTMGVDMSKIDRISCNHNPYILQYFRVPPTSIDIRFDQIGADAIQHLLKLINGKITRSGEEYLVQPRFPK